MTETEPVPDRAAGRMSDPMTLVPNAVHLIRTTQTINLQLSQMADQKANMLMAASSIVFTLTLAQLPRGGPMTVAIAILAVTALVSVVLAILTVRPSVAHMPQPVPDDANLLFFGIFTAMPEEEFIERMLLRLQSDEAGYRTMLRDIYQNGRVLQGKKYRLLAAGYGVFLAGLMLAAVAAAITLLA